MNSKYPKEPTSHHTSPDHSALIHSQLDNIDFVRYIVTSVLNGMLDKKIDVAFCDERHKEVSKVAEKLDKLLWAIMISLASTVGTLIVLLFKTH